MGLFNFLFKPKEVVQRNSPFQGGGISRLNTSWNPILSSPNAELRDLKNIRSRARDLRRNNAIVSSYVNNLCRNVNGNNGFTFKSEILNSRGTSNDALCSYLETEWYRFTRKGNLDVTGRYNLENFLDLCVESLAIDGEVLIRRHRGIGPYGYSLQLIDVDLLTETSNKPVLVGNRLLNGVEVDALNQPVAYHILTGYQADGVRVETERVEAKDIIHAFIPHRNGAVRGVSWLAPVMDSIFQLGSYRDAELTAARLAASKALIYETAKGEAYESPEWTYQPAGGLEAGMVESLPEGVTAKLLDPTHPNSNFAAFSQALLKEIAAGLKGGSYISILKDWSQTNFSSSRMGTSEDREEYRKIQRFVIENILDVVFEDWLVSSIGFGKVQVKKYAPGISVEACKEHSFIGRSWSYNDPLKDVAAVKEGLDRGVTTLSSVLGERGIDLEDHFKSLARERELAKTYGVEDLVYPQKANLSQLTMDEIKAEDLANSDPKQK